MLARDPLFAAKLCAGGSDEVNVGQAKGQQMMDARPSAIGGPPAGGVLATIRWMGGEIPEYRTTEEKRWNDVNTNKH